MPTELALVVVTYNSARCIRPCLDSLLAHALPGRDVRIVVVDNASADETRSILAEYAARSPAVEVIALAQNIGFGPANNEAFARVPADHYLLVNPDAWLVGDSISPVLSAFAREADVAIVGLPLVYPDGSPQTHAFAFTTWQKWLLQALGVPVLVRYLIRLPLFRWLLARLPLGREYVRTHAAAAPGRPVPGGGTRPVDWVCGGGMALRGDFVRACGGFDRQIFLYGEDEDLCMEAWQRGFRVVVVDALPLVHELGWGANRFNEKVAGYKYASLRYFIAKHHGGTLSGLLLRLLLPLHVYGFWRWLRLRWSR